MTRIIDRIRARERREARLVMSQDAQIREIIREEQRRRGKARTGHAIVVR